MTPLTETKLLNSRLSSQPKLVSVEISNSENKRYGEGDRDPLIVRSAWTHTIDRVSRGKGTQSSPQIQTPDGELIWYGETPALGEHKSIATLSKDKSEVAKFLLMPMLLPSDNGGAHNGHLRLVMSHHSFFDPTVKAQIESQVLGRHQFNRNGQLVDVTVDSVELVPEGVGAYWLASELKQLNPGYSLIVEIGYRTTEVWLVDDSGEPIKGDPLQFGVYNLASAIAADDAIREAVLGTASTPKQVSDTQISIALKHDRIAKLAPEQWQLIKKRHISRWCDDVVGTVLSQYESEMNQAEQVLFSGGGSMLIKPQLRSLDFWVDDQAQTASVRGAYYHVLSRTQL